MAGRAVSIRTAVLIAILVGLALPALVLIVLEGERARRHEGPEIAQERASMLALGAVAVAQPAWSLSEVDLQLAMRGLLANPAVCEVRVLELPKELPPMRSDQPCDPAQSSTLSTAVLYQGRPVARLQVAFDDGEVDRRAAKQRRSTAVLVVVQVLLGALVLFAVLSVRLLGPIERLKVQAGRLASREPTPPTPWPRQDELGQLGEHLNAVQGQIRELLDALEAKNAQLHQMAMYDHLTGLPNRTLLRELFLREAAAARRSGLSVALMFLDLDQFKAINDTHGHQVGDELLVHVAAAVRDTLRESDIVCRMGGDEFLILLPQAEGRDSVAATAGRVLAATARPHEVSTAGEPLRVRGSIGVAMYPADGADFDALVRAADLAMYRSKDLGRGRSTFYEVALDQTLRTRLEMERDLGLAVEQRQLRLHYQAVVDGRDGSLVGCEALVRWQHPQRGLLAPGEFIDAAEDSGLVHAMGRWVLETACAQLAAWRAAGHPALRMAVNVSALQLRDAAFAGLVEEQLRRHRLPARRLTLEITESVLLADGDGALEAVRQLRSLGVALALDDFGTGYSSLSYLKKLRPEALKIDRGFVRDLPADADDCALARAIVAMAQALGVAVVAEGVETEAQRQWLLAEGCRLQQGYLWARPVTAAEFEARWSASLPVAAAGVSG